LRGREQENEARGYPAQLGDMITHRIHDWARTQPDRPAIVYNDVAIRYADWSTVIGAMRAFLAAQGVQAGTTAAVLVANLFDAWSLVLALRSLGATTVQLQSLDAIAALGLRDLACLVVTQPEAEAMRLDLGRMPVRTIVLSEAVMRTTPTIASTAAGDDREAFGGHLVYTSGTTGSYKKLLLAGPNECARNEARAAFYGFRKDTYLHGVELGLWTAMGSKNPPAVWHRGGCVVFDQRPDWPRHFFRQPLTHAGLIPSLVKDLLDSPVHPGQAPPGFQLSVAAGFLPLNVVERVRDRLRTAVCNVYGTTELNEPPLRSTSEPLADFYWLEPTPGRAIRIADAFGNECGVGEEGELGMRLTALDCSGYVDDPDATARFFREGWFCPGDLAVRRADGRIQLRGRATDVLNLDGQKIAAAPLELAIQRELGVSEVCLFSGLASDGVEEVVLAIEADHAPTKAQLEAVAAHCAKFPRLRFGVVKAFPRSSTGTGKTLRTELRKRVLERLQATARTRDTD
jgi:acyl-coenzyme A synthetase/AMP-(fatty) acid ligase